MAKQLALSRIRLTEAPAICATGRRWVNCSIGGIELHFAHESIDLSSRGGRLSADIQAVVAADYIRNLRDEVRKGFYGRLKQGLYPLHAPLGYVDNGGGQVKTIDPLRGPLVVQAFELYSTGQWSLSTCEAGIVTRADCADELGGS